MSAERIMAVFLSVLLAAWLMVTLGHHPNVKPADPPQPGPPPATPTPDSKPKRPAPKPPR